jgi:UDP-N-acetylglucosamine--N-acetylmuramyl-(pentapeptide) pyrophosphoryl-undecaprenol N-acetylglucosamine transferase
MRVIIAGGGTGGHLFPAIALGEELKRQRPGIEILYVGSSFGLEAKLIPPSGLKYELFPVHGFTGLSAPEQGRAVVELIKASKGAFKTLLRFRPDLVVSAGGYASVPTSLAAIAMRTPLLLMEQNVRPGLANRLLWRFARKVCVGFEEARPFFSSRKVEVTGNPVRFRTVTADGKVGGDSPILVLGGSSGAHRLNLGVLGALKILGKTVIKRPVVHQTGEADKELVVRGYRELGWEGEVVPFIDDIAEALGRAGLVIARSGAVTVSEIAVAGRAAIFVPYPFHRDQQQELNARVLERAGGAIVIKDDDNLAANLADKLRELLADPAKLIQMASHALSAARPDAAQRLAAICIQVASGASPP